MITLCQAFPKGHQVEDYYSLGQDMNLTLKDGDVATYGWGNPNAVTLSDSEGSSLGFIISAWHGQKISYVIGILNVISTLGDRDVTFWRLNEKSIKPREYIPSEWSTPLPLP